MITKHQVDPETWAKLVAAANAQAGPVPDVRTVKAKASELVGPLWLPPGTWVVPLRIDPVTNGGAVKRQMIGRAGKDRRAVSRALAVHLFAVVPFTESALHGETVVCRLVRLAPGTMDDDNLPATLKYVRDTIAMFLGVDDGPAGVVQWRYGQEKSARWGVRIELERGTA